MKAKRATVSQMMAATCRALRLGREFPDRPFRVYANTERDALRVADALKAAGMISDGPLAVHGPLVLRGAGPQRQVAVRVLRRRRGRVGARRLLDRGRRLIGL